MERVREIKEQFRRKIQVCSEQFKRVEGCVINNYVRKIGIYWGSSGQTRTSIRDVKSVIPHFRWGKENYLPSSCNIRQVS